MSELAWSSGMAVAGAPEALAGSGCCNRYHRLGGFTRRRFL